MEAIYKVPVAALPNLMKSIKTLFDNTKMVEVIIRQEATKEERKNLFADTFRKLEASRKKSEKIFVPVDLDAFKRRLIISKISKTKLF